MGVKKRKGQSKLSNGLIKDPMAVTWSENYHETIDKYWKLLPDSVGKLLATLAIFAVGISVNGDWINIIVHLLRQFGYWPITENRKDRVINWSNISLESLGLKDLGTFWLFAVAVSYILYFFIGGFLHWYYYVRQRDRSEEWKCQPKKWLSPELERHEIILGSATLMMNATVSALLSCYIANGGSCTVYYKIDDYGWWWFVLQWPVIFIYQVHETDRYTIYTTFQLFEFTMSVVGLNLAYLYSSFKDGIWIRDYLTYWIHRMYHLPSLYRHFHKLHHKYKQPTAFSVTAIHPVESFSMQLILAIPLFTIPTHWFAFYIIAIYTYYHGIIDHSGVNFKAFWWQPWQPDAIFHDNHHQYFHVNFAFNIQYWDKLHGTYRQKDRVYTEDIFYGKGRRIDEVSTEELKADLKERESENPLAYRDNKMEFKLSKRELKALKQLGHK